MNLTKPDVLLSELSLSLFFTNTLFSISRDILIVKRVCKIFFFIKTLILVVFHWNFPPNAPNVWFFFLSQFSLVVLMHRITVFNRRRKLTMHSPNWRIMSKLSMKELLVLFNFYLFQISLLTTAQFLLLQLSALTLVNDECFQLFFFFTFSITRKAPEKKKNILFWFEDKFTARKITSNDSRARLTVPKVSERLTSSIQWMSECYSKHSM